MPCQESQGVIVAGIGGSAISVPVNAGIQSNHTVSLIAGIVDQEAGPPILPLAAHTGNGNVLLTWQPATGQVFDYEIQCATSITGRYFSYGRSIWRKPMGLISNLPMTRTMYFRIRSRTEDGHLSDWVQAKLGVLQKQTTIMRIKAPAGSVVLNGARVAILDWVDRLAGFQASGNINVTA